MNPLKFDRLFHKVHYAMNLRSRRSVSERTNEQRFALDLVLEDLDTYSWSFVSRDDTERPRREPEP